MQFLLKPKAEYSGDVVVIGAGTAGVFAAVSAARSGAKTILVEKNSSLGGTVTTGGVNFPGLFFAWGKQIIAGPCWEAIEKTVALGGAVLPKMQYKAERHWEEQILVNRFVFRSVLLEMCREAGVEIWTNAMLSAIREEQDGTTLLLTAKDGLYQLSAKVVIDATGDANAAAMAGYPTVKSESQQPATPQNHLCGYRFEDVDPAELHEKFINAGLPDYISEQDMLKYLRIYKFDVHIPCENAHTSQGKTRLECDAMALMGRLYTFCRGLHGLENLMVDYCAEETGVRETVRIVGEDTLTAQDYISGRHFEDAVCYAYYPIDLHVMNGIKQQFFENEKVGQIPYGALIPKGAKRMLCAGRCISADTDANSAVRVQAPCMAMGQAAGCAAAIAAKENIPVADVPYAELCRSLQRLGAIVPE